MRRLLIAAGLLLWVAGTGPAAALPEDLPRARLLHRAAGDHLADPSLESRTLAVRQLEEAIALDPRGRAGKHWFLLAQVRELGGFDTEAAAACREAIAQDPGLRAARLALGRIERRRFLRTLDREALARGIAELDSATRCFPPSSEPWLALVPLLYESGDRVRAGEAAGRALRLRPRLPEASLAAAMLAWREGRVEDADSLFRAAIPRLAPARREPFEHPGRHIGRLSRALEQRRPAPPALFESDAPALRPVAEDALPDPDPTTPQNEVLLEYWARATHALLLFEDPIRPAPDDRADAYLRYGPPAKVLWNPLGTNLNFRPSLSRPLWTDNPYRGSLEEYPFDAQIWYYPELNMQVMFHDRALHGHYTLPALREPLENSWPDPEVLAKRQDLVNLGDGFALFPTQPPREQRLEVIETLAAFEGRDGPRLSAFVQADAESLEARWVVIDATGRAVARASRAMERSLCGGRDGAAVAFDAGLPPGRYEVSVSLRDGRGRRGFTRRSATLSPVSAGLSLSDLVLCCGEPNLLVEREAVRLEPLPGGIVTGRSPLAAYFEIYRLAAGPDGRSRYAFDYRVERLAEGGAPGREAPSGVVSTWASREEVFTGRVRRQFLTLPIADLPPGRYRVTTTVHDLVTGESDARSAGFTRR